MERRSTPSAPPPVTCNNSRKWPPQMDSSPEEQHREHRVRNHMHERRMRKAAATQRALDSRESYCPPRGVNLRDVGAVTAGPMRDGALFRSSELLRSKSTPFPSAIPDTLTLPLTPLLSLPELSERSSYLSTITSTTGTTLLAPWPVLAHSAGVP